MPSQRARSAIVDERIQPVDRYRHPVTSRSNRIETTNGLEEKTYVIRPGKSHPPTLSRSSTVFGLIIGAHSLSHIQLALS